MSMPKVLSARLRPWSDFADDDWPTLFVGNGLSINVWPGFSYDRIYDEADLAAAAIHVFDELGTTNFETVLEAMMHAEIVLRGLGRGTGSVRRVVKHVRDSLFETVRSIHVPW